ncbi:hypothetical protein AAGS40_23300 [Paraburkholderia sp. PREW-6R]|uniref:hypothetical protein n=1 Tax=Paraburkholderia sp. PREW-6R TaxID=3141544 RepID=UPI0031F57DFE
MSRTQINATEQLKAGSASVKTAEVNVGTAFVYDATFQVTDSDVKATSHVIAQVLGTSPSDGRSPQEIYLEQVSVLATPGDGVIRFDLQPKRGKFQGRFVIGYQIA